MNLPTFNEIFRDNVAYLNRPRKLLYAYPGYCAGKREAQRRLRQLEKAKGDEARSRSDSGGGVNQTRL